MTLATADRRGRPTARTVLLKSADGRGFTFFTNMESRKGRQIAENPRAALCFYWDPLWHQVLVEGRLERLSAAEVDAYWASRPRDSQLGAWASLQSRPLASRRTLLERFSRFKRSFAGKVIPRPAYWTGLRLVPDRIEFWRGRPHRLHDRLAYVKSGRRWKRGLLFP